MYCIHCGASLAEGAKFCAQCGKTRSSEAAEPAAPARQGDSPILTLTGPPPEREGGSLGRTALYALGGAVGLLFLISVFMTAVFDYELAIKPGQLFSMAVMLAFLIAPTVFSVRGKGYRGLWFGLAATFLALSVLSCMGSWGSAYERASSLSPHEREEMYRTMRFGANASIWLFILFLGNLIAGFFYRKESR